MAEQKITTTKHIEFVSFDDLLAFLFLCETRALIGDKSHYQWIYLDTGPRFALAIPGDLGVVVERHSNLLGGSVREGTLDWERIHLNELLLQVAVRRQPIITQRVKELVLACDSKASGACAMLFQAWSDVPKRDDAESVFRIMPEMRSSWYAVQISAVHPDFDFERFRGRLPEGVRAFIPAWSGDEACFLHVEAGFQHPRPREFFHLYDENNKAPTTDDDGKAASEHIVLIQAGNERRSDDGIETWWEPICHLVGGSFTRSHEVYRLSIGPSNVTILSSDSEALGEDERLPVPLGIGRISGSVGVAHDLEERIGKHEKILEDLHARRVRLRDLRDHDSLPIYVFRQAATDDGLPLGLESFLQRPLSELSGYLYGRTGNEVDGFEHYLIGESAVPVSRALAMPADETYLCREQWAEEDLSLYLKANTCFSYAIEEAGLVQQLRDFVETIPGLEDSAGGYILAEPAVDGHETGAVEFKLLWPGGGADELRPLDEMFFFTNQLNGGRESIATVASVNLDVSTKRLDIELDEATRRLNEELLEKARLKVAETERHWESLRARAQETLLEARLGDAALHVTRQAYDQVPASWSDFLNQVRSVDHQLSRLKIEALDRWFEAHGARETLLDQTRQVLTDVDQEITSKRADYEVRLDNLSRKNEQLRQALVTLGEVREKVGEEFRECRAQALKSVQAHREILDQLTDLRRFREKCRRRIAAYERDITTCDEMLDKVEESNRACDGKREMLEERMRQLESRREELREARVRLVQKEEEQKNAEEEFRREEGQLSRRKRDLDSCEVDLRSRAGRLKADAARVLDDSFMRRNVVSQNEAKITWMLQSCTTRLRSIVGESIALEAVEAELKKLAPQNYVAPDLIPAKPHLLRRLLLFWRTRNKAWENSARDRETGKR